MLYIVLSIFLPPLIPYAVSWRGDETEDTVKQTRDKRKVCVVLSICFHQKEGVFVHLFVFVYIQKHFGLPEAA